MALTPFGKALRKLRIDRDLLLKDMADDVSMTSAYLSAVEAGRKPIPRNLITQLRSRLNLTPEQESELREAADMSASSAQFHFPASASPFDRSLATQLARNFGDLNLAQKEAIKSILNGRKA
jgi:transcriptional regulator with XRE-family HTH domain